MIRTLYLTMLVTVLGACGKPSRKGADAPTDNTTVFSLVGLLDSSFQSDCAVQEEHKGRSYLEIVSFAENSFQRTYRYFDGTDCDEAKKRSTYVDALIHAKKEATAQLEGWMTYVYTYQSITAQPESIYMAELWNKNLAFGLTGWEVGASKDVSGLRYNDKDDLKNTSGDVGRRTLKIEGDVLSVARRDEQGVVQSGNPYTYKKLPQ